MNNLLYSGSRSPSSASKQFHFQLIPNFLTVKNYKEINDQKATNITYHISMHKGFQNYDQIRAPVHVKSYEHQETVPFGRIPHILNFYIPVYNAHRRIDFTLKVHSKRSQDQKMTQIGQMNINSNQIIQQFLNNGTKHFSQEQQVSDTISISYELFIEKTKLLLNDLVKQSMPSLHSPKKQTPTKQIKSTILLDQAQGSNRRFSRKNDSKHQIRFGREFKSNIQAQQQHMQSSIQSEKSSQITKTFDRSVSQNIRLEDSKKQINNVQVPKQVQQNPIKNEQKVQEIQKQQEKQIQASIQAPQNIQIQQPNTEKPSQQSNVQQQPEQQKVIENEVKAPDQIQNKQQKVQPQTKPIIQTNSQVPIQQVKSTEIPIQQIKTVQIPVEQAKTTQAPTQQIKECEIPTQQVQETEVCQKIQESQPFQFLMPQIVITECFDKAIEGNLFEKYENTENIMIETQKQEQAPVKTQQQPTKNVQQPTESQNINKVERIDKEQEKKQQTKQEIKESLQNIVIETQDRKFKKIDSEDVSPINILTTQIVKDQISEIKQKRAQASKNWSRRSIPSSQDPTKQKQNEDIMQKQYHHTHHTKSQQGDIEHPFGQNPKLTTQAPEHDEIIKKQEQQKEISKEPTKKSQSMIDQAGDSQYIKEQLEEGDLKKSESVLAKHGSQSQQQAKEHEQFNQFIRDLQKPQTVNKQQKTTESKKDTKKYQKSATIAKGQKLMTEIMSMTKEQIPFEQKGWVNFIFLFILLGSFYYFILNPIVQKNMYRDPTTKIFGSDE